MDRIVTFHVVRERPGRQLAVLARMLTDRRRLRTVDGLVFARVLGTGRGEDTGPSADLLRQVYFLVWRDLAAARAFRDAHAIARRWDSLDVERDLVLGLVSGHGSWSGRPVLDGMRRLEPGGPADGAVDGPGDGAVVVVTRARIRLRAWRAFRRAGRATAGARPAGRCWALGFGELPVGLLGTVSCWRSAADLAAWLASDGAHAAAAAQADEWFAESLFARFAPTDDAARPQ